MAKLFELEHSLVQLFVYLFFCDHFRYHGQRLAVPGEPKHLIDISEEDLLETSDQEFASLLAKRSF